jgi:RNA polymerase sigma factor (TIGR02999 family)
VPDDPRTEFTRLLLEAGADGADSSISATMLELVYAELRAQAARLMSAQRTGHTLQPTALVHEAYLKLVHSDKVAWQNRAHFLGVATRAMRQILVDHARAKASEKRGGEQQRVTFHEDLGQSAGGELELLTIHEALEHLKARDPRAARVAELKLFGGLTGEEIAHVVDVSHRTVNSDWALARSWLARALGEGAGPETA